MLAASKENIVDIIRSTARFGEAYALRKYDAIIAAAQDAAVFGRALPSNAVRIRLYIDTYQEYQKHLDALLKALHETVEKLQDTLIYDQICLLQSLRGIGFLSAVVLIAEMGNFKLFLPRKSFTPTLGLTLLSNSPENSMAIKSICPNVAPALPGVFFTWPRSIT